ncbi:ATP-binding protein [Streptomyces sp. NBC_00654]|uniref:ATP-binding protein n=1 Tax=Streptomyces sp. NBC_00654 TaxID=2975799 RepID=UPI002251BA0F|nr:ATP-binding protein [Streptomyces sp. NBC_00654]MCX4967139.1 ATP-binding protein [Streptomyces sp. NBC_00654]
MTTSLTARRRARTSLHLAHRPSACPRARTWAAEALTRWDATDEETDDVLLVMCELVTNAVIHTTGPIRAHLSRDQAGCYHVQVDDGGPTVPPAARPDEHDSDEHGRGLVIVDHLSARHGHSRAPYPYRSRAWAVLAPTTPHPAGPRTLVPAARTLEPAS